MITLAVLTAGPAPAAPVLHKQGAWRLGAGDDPAVCVAVALFDERQLQVRAGDGQVSLAVAGGAEPPRGRRGRIEVDGHALPFEPQYGAGNLVAMDAPLDAAAIAALRRARWLRITVDGGVLMDAMVQGSGFAEVLDSAAACSRGESGWWGKGAKAPG